MATKDSNEVRECWGFSLDVLSADRVCFSEVNNGEILAMLEVCGNKRVFFETNAFNSFKFLDNPFCANKSCFFGGNSERRLFACCNINCAVINI